MSEDSLFILNCDEEIALGLKSLIDSQAGCQSQATPRKNLDGSVADQFDYHRDPASIGFSKGLLENESSEKNHNKRHCYRKPHG